MYIATQTFPAVGYFGVEQSIRMLGEAGFDGIDFTMTKPDGIWLSPETSATAVRQAREAMRATGLLPLQAHAPFPGYKFGDSDYNTLFGSAVLRSIRTAGELGVPVIVVHPIHCPGYTAEQQLQWNLEYYGSLAPTARDSGVKIAVENMWGVAPDGKKIPNVCSFSQELALYCDSLDREVFTCCLDLGHSPLIGESTEHAVRTLGHRLGALHVQDNDLIDDSHDLPFGGKIDWSAVTDALAAADYCGSFTFEPCGHMKRIPPELLCASLKYLSSIGKYLVSEIEKKKTIYKGKK